MSSKNEQRRRRAQVSARLDPPILEVVERAAAAERRPVSSLVRNILSDWAQAQATERHEAVA